MARAAPDVAPRLLTASATPLGPGSGALDSTIADVDVSVTIDDELWCLLGPGFFTDC